MYEDKIGNLDGIPATARHQANLIRLGRMRETLQNRYDELPAGDERREALGGKLAGLQAISKQVSTDPSAAGAPMLLGLDPSGNGKAIVSFGNPDTAQNIATNVPGTSSKLAGMSKQMNRALQARDAASRAGAGSTASIAWMGYDAPQKIVPEAGIPDYADRAEKALVRFQDGLDATHQGPDAHKTVIGHSYGTVVTGHAVQNGSLNTDELVSIGSPGMVRGVDEASGLHLDGVPQDQVGEHVRASVAENDLIHVTNVPYDDYSTPPGEALLGPDPMDPHVPQPADPKFGADAFPSDPGTESLRGGPYRVDDPNPSREMATETSTSALAASGRRAHHRRA